MPLAVVTPSALAPVSLASALRHCNVLEQDADLVWLYLQAATVAVEDYTGLALITQGFRLDLQDWPSPRPGESLGEIVLPRSPLLAVSSVKYYVGSVLTTWDAANYRVDTVSRPGRIVLVSTSSFPTIPATDVRPDALQVAFTAGYGTKPSSMPPRLRMAVLMLTHYWFDERKPVNIGNIVNELPMSVRAILRAERIESTEVYI